MGRYAIVLTLALSGFVMGCKGTPATSSGILDDFQVELKTPIHRAADVDQDPCLYPVLKKLWEEYYFYTDGGARRLFKFKLIEQTSTIDILPSRRVVRFTGRANVLRCELGSYCIPDYGHPEDFCVERTCGTKLVDEQVQVDGEDRPLKITVERGKTLTLGAEYSEVVGAFDLYAVRNLQREFQDFKSIDEALFQRYLAIRGGEIFNAGQPYIRYEGSLAGAHCANARELSLKDLVGDTPH